MVPVVTRLVTRITLAVLPVVAVLFSTVTAGAVTYTYDARHRLTGATYENGVAVSYSYDSVGNRLTEQVSVPYTSYEDGEDGTISGWDIYDSDPAGAAIANVYDDSRSSRVIELTGAGTANGYRLRNDDLSNWNDTENGVIEWSMQYSENYVVYIAAQTTQGFRYIYYTAADTDKLGDGTYIHHGLGSTTRDGTWQTIVRDLEYELKEAQPDNDLEAVLAFLIRGSGRVDDIRTRTAIPADLDSDGDALTDVLEITLYSTDPYDSDSDDDGLDDGEELSYWGDGWNGDVDGDGLINIVDGDSDGDAIDDGIEVSQGTDPGDPGSYPTIVVYEDAEDGLLLGWDIYDGDPQGAFIDNVYDSERDGRVIEFTGSGTANGYRLRRDDHSWWDDDNYTVLEWSMRYAENFVIYIAAQTTDGFRYLYYTPVDTDKLGDSTYIHHGLGKGAMDGSWQTFVRDLEYDLKEAQPDNNLEAVLGFLIRGSGRVDDITTRESLPADLDSDGDSIVDGDEMMVYGTHPYHGDSDGDTMDDGEELSYWGDGWNGDADGDGQINLLDADSDDDGFSDGLEVREGTDPADGASRPTAAHYEDAEDGTISGWDIYDGDPAGATIANVYDDARASRVIEFTGGGTANGYRLRSDDHSWWEDDNFTVMEWSMRYAENFVIYIAAQTTDGFRYIYYTAAESDNLGDSTYVHHGLGGAVRDGNWHTVIRDLEADLQEAQPDNNLEAVLGFLIRGSGRVDDILTRQAMP